jgi:anaerobic magnesium-protoporphyrin IX monomethyl ester cyclase
MKILLVFPMWTGSYTGFVNKYFARKAGGVFPPLNLALLAAIAEEEGHEVEIIDAEIDRILMPDLVDMVLSRKADIVGMTGMSPFFHLSKDLARLLKEKGETADICIGGKHITIMEEKCFDDAFDFGFIGDGEESWTQFLRAYSRNEPLDNVPGLMYRSEGKVLKNEGVSSSKDLDIYPRPAYHLLKMNDYKLGTLRGRLKFTTVMTTRGCPWKCIFCASDKLDTTRISKRSTNSIVDEMEHLVDSYGIRHFYFMDDVLTLQRSRTVEFCNEVLRRDLNITFEGSTRANLLDEELVALMKDAGLIRMSFGLETVDTEMRETMKKEVPLKFYSEANAVLNKYKVEALNSVMIGLPGESRENVLKTLDFLKKDKNVKQANFAIAVPYPGTDFHEMAQSGKHGIELLTDDFSEYRRYGVGVTNVNGLSADDLTRLQNEGFVSVYSRYWRWWPVVQKNGIMGLVMTFVRLLNLLAAKVTDRLVAFNKHPSLE